MFERDRPQTTETRLMDLEDLAVYLSLGRTKAAEFGRECGAQRHIGRRCLYDKQVIDAAIDNLGPDREGEA